MSIHDEVAFDKEGKPIPGGRTGELLRRVFVPLSVLLVGLLGYGLGRLSGSGQRPPVEIRYDPHIISALSTEVISSRGAMPAPAPAALTAAAGEVYASSKGTRYYYPGCKSTISVANKISFPSAGAAEAAGYTLASGCQR